MSSCPAMVSALLRVFVDLKKASLSYDSTSGSRWSFERHKFGGFSLTISQKSWVHFFGLQKWHSQAWLVQVHEIFMSFIQVLYFILLKHFRTFVFQTDSEATLVARSTCFIGFQDCVSIESYQSLMLGVLPQQKPQNGTTKICLNGIPVAAGILGMFFLLRALSGCCAASSNACRAAFAGAKEHDFGPDTSGTVMLSLGCKWMAEDYWWTKDDQILYQLRDVKVY